MNLLTAVTFKAMYFVKTTLCYFVIYQIYQISTVACFCDTALHSIDLSFPDNEFGQWMETSDMLAMCDGMHDSIDISILVPGFSG